MWTDELRWLEDLLSRGRLEEIFESLRYDTDGTQEDRLAALAIDCERLLSIADPSRGQGAVQALALSLREKIEASRLLAIEQITGVAAVSDPYRSAQIIQTSLFMVDTPAASYRANKKLARGDIAQLYQGECSRGDYQGEPVVLKIAQDPADNDLMLDEVEALKVFSSSKAAQLKQLPVLLDTFKTSDGKSGSVFRLVEGHDAISIRERYPEGVPVKHAVWIFRRLLSVIGFAHSQGVIHGNIEPSHIIVRPHDHNVTLIDWSYSIIAPARTGKGFKCLNPEYSGPEVGQKKPPIPASDLFSVGKCMIYLLGGDIQTDTLPDSVDPKMQRLVKFFVRASAMQRAQDAWEMYDELGKLRKELFGPHSFEVFEV